jgi:nicotinate-nucleotide adenylyltransferase
LSPKYPLKESNALQDANLRWEDLLRVVDKLNAENSGDQGSIPCREEKFSASDIEFHLEPPLYTYNTLEKLSALHPRRHFALLMGGDNINILHKWYRGEEILNRYPIIVYPREGVDTEAICNEKGAIYIDAPMVNISSTQIRTMMAAGEDVSELRY